MNRLILFGIARLLAIGTGVKLAQGKGKQAVVSPSLQPVEMQVQKTTPTAQQTSTNPKPQPIAAAPKLPSITISTCNGELGDANVLVVATRFYVGLSCPCPLRSKGRCSFCFRRKHDFCPV